MSNWGDHKEKVRFQRRERMKEAAETIDSKTMGYADRVGGPEILLLIVANVAIIIGVLVALFVL